MSFDESLPSDRDRARSLLGDTTNDPSLELLTDGAVDAPLTLYGYAGGVAFLAESLAARFAQQVSSTSLPGGLSAAWSERVKYWTGLADRMRKLGGVTGSSAAFSHTPERTDGYSQYADESGG